MQFGPFYGLKQFVWQCNPTNTSGPRGKRHTEAIRIGQQKRNRNELWNRQHYDGLRRPPCQPQDATGKPIMANEG